MTGAMASGFETYNALTSAWLPLVDEAGRTTWASPVEVWCGDKDAADLDYPRDDFRVYARLLLSALTQALFPASTRDVLRQRLDQPLSREVVEPRIAAVHGDFDLFGPTPFLQVVPPTRTPTPERGGSPFVFPDADLYQPQVRVNAVSLPVALVALFAQQTYAGADGRGYGTGPGGQPGAFTLVDPGSVRRAAWANTLALGGLNYAPDEERPWSNEKIGPRPRASIGLVRGLFFQPRAVWLIPAGEGRCSFSGVDGLLVRLSPLLAKSQLTKKPRQGEDVWQHPCAPMAVNSQRIAPVRLDAARPAWTGLAQLLSPLSKVPTRISHPLEGPARVLKQWKEMAGRRSHFELLVLDFDRDKAIVRRRFFESFPLTDLLAGDAEAIERLRALVGDAQTVERSLLYALALAHDSQRRGGLAMPDAKSSFWEQSEPLFLDWLDAIVGMDSSDDAEGRANVAEALMRQNVRRAALSIFDAHAALSEFDPRKQERITKARQKLRRLLWPSPAPAHAAPNPEVTP